MPSPGVCRNISGLLQDVPASIQETAYCGASACIFSLLRAPCGWGEAGGGGCVLSMKGKDGHSYTGLTCVYKFPA